MVFPLSFLRVMRFWYGVTLDKLDPNPEKIEISKLSLGIINSEGFVIISNSVMSLGILDN